MSNYVVKGKHLFADQAVLLLRCFIYSVNGVFSQSLKNQIFKKILKERSYRLPSP